MLADPFRIEDRQLEEYLPPVLYPACPLTKHVHGGQVQHLEERFIRRENTFTLGNLAELAVVAFIFVV
jgi:hypothetical protein